MTKQEFLGKKIELLEGLLNINKEKYILDADFYALYGGYKLVLINKEGRGEDSAGFESTRKPYKEFLTYLNGIIKGLQFNDYYSKYQK
jgi:hypothetical protein